MRLDDLLDEVGKRLVALFALVLFGAVATGAACLAYALVMETFFK